MDERHPTLEPEQRYWRRRANRRVRKARLTRNALRVTRVVVVQLLIVAIVVLVAGRALSHLTASRALVVQRVELRGVERGAEPRIRDGLTAFFGHNLMEIDLDRVAEVVRRDAWVRQARVHRVLPDTLAVEVTERRPGALAVLEGKAFLIDSTGEPIGIAGPGLWEDLPLLTGLDRLSPEARQRRLATGIEWLARLRQVSPGFVAGISEMNVAPGDRITVHTVVPGPRLLLDPEQIDRNVRRWLLHRDEIETRIGGAEYVDLRWRDRITVLPVDGGGA